ncbi:MAG: NAD-dependent epimerase/dehydratase family protein [Acidobacteria bacterium]|nr:NAD-dependent epimerase/dehydratase family protein [Acidobacteriota bacterium]
MRILVTGGAGFIGSHIVDHYIANGHQVMVVDDLSTGRLENLNPAADFVELDVRDPGIEKLFKMRFDVVNHQAARGNVRASMEDPMVYADVNVRGGINLLECCRKHGVRKFIYASTGGCVYGELQYKPADENHPMVPRDPYGASKASFELYLPVYKLNYGLEYTIFRYPNVYGPRQDPLGEAGVVSIFARQMLLGLPVVINGDGEQRRDFVYVEDVARANVMALASDKDTVYNLGLGKGVTVNEIFQVLRDITCYSQPAGYGPPKLGEVRDSFLEASKIARELGWRPQTDLRSGLEHTVEFVRQKELVREG